VLLGYLLGGIPSGVLLARFAGVDPRRHGSGNIGATNVARAAGRWLGLLTLVADVLKGALAVGVATAVVPGPWPAALAGVAAVVGHCWPVALRFRGGKGVATGLGVLLVLAPVAALVGVGVFVVVLRAARWVSVASLAGTVAVPAAAATAGASLPVLAAAAAVTVCVVVRHRENLARLRDGLEPRV
jgi:glycerol-3-phosphate acyltransferase PlsY